MEYVHSGALGTRCPKVGLGFFFYPSLNASIRGALATDSISAGEVVCAVPVRSMLSDLSVGNSSLRVIATAAADGDKKKGLQKRRSGDSRSLMALLVLRELARESSPLMPYATVLNSHDTDGIPMLWPPQSPKWASFAESRYLRSLASHSRAEAIRLYESIVPMALELFSAVLSEGLECAGGGDGGGGKSGAPDGGSCPLARLQQVYSREAFMRTIAIIGARDWVLPMYGRTRRFMAPVVDLLNFGQAGLRAKFDEQNHAFVVTATRRIQRGSELLFYYGSNCKEQSINLYGFAPTEARPCVGGGGSRVGVISAAA